MDDANKKIRVLHIIGNLRFGGAQVVVKQIVENSNPEHFEHFVYSLRQQKNDIALNTTVLRHSYRNYDIRKFFDLIKICKEKKIDIVHAHLQKSILGALLLTYFHNIPVIIHEHGPITRPGASNAVYRLLLRLLHNRSKGIVANSNAISKALHRYSKIPGEKIRIIPNAVDLLRFRNDPETRIRLRQKYRLRDQDIAIGFIGRLHPVKGIDDLIRAMKILVEHNALFQLFIVGDGPLEKMLVQKVQNSKIKNHVLFLGYQEDVSEIMNLFDLGCMPSRHEAFGIAALEMMSMKVPLICSCVEGLAELTEHRKTALHISEVTPEAIAQSLLKLAEDEILKDDLRINAFDYCQRYSIENFVNKIENLYHQIIDPDTR